MKAIFHLFNFDKKHYWVLNSASIRERIIAQLIDGIFLGIICGLILYLFSGGEIRSIWVSPMIPQYLLEVKPGYQQHFSDFWWGGFYFPVTLPYGKTIHPGFPAPLFWLLYALYYTLFTCLYGQTPGKMAKRLVVLNADQTRPVFSTAFFRWLCYIIALAPLGLGFWWGSRNSTNQGWHDLINHTRVYRFEER